MIYVNEALDQYLVSPLWTPSLIKESVENWLIRMENLVITHRPPPKLRQAVASLLECNSREEFANGLDTVLIVEFKNKLASSSIGGKQRFLVELLIAFWSVGAIAWPAKSQTPFSSLTLTLDNLGFLSPQKELLIVLRDFLTLKTADGATNFRFLLDHLFSRANITEIGDITPEAFYIEERKNRTKKMRSPCIEGVLFLLREKYPTEAMTWSPESYGFLLNKLGPRAKDDEYKWLLGIDPKLEQWAKLAKEHLEISPGNYKRRISALNEFLSYLLENKNISRTPKEYFSAINKPTPLFNVPGNEGRTTMTIVHEFLNEVLLKECTGVTENEIPYILPGFSNPLPKAIYRNVNKGETHRDVMPTYLMNLAKEILTENDYAWPKKAGGVGDKLIRKNPKTGIFEEIWSPVRTYVILIKLLLPARTHQVRVLDSGEGDTYCYGSDGQWIKNQSPLRIQSTDIVERGVFRKYIRKDKSEGAVFYFNTNKTGDIGSIVKGYTMPWEKTDALQLLTELRDWQEEYNPVTGPTAWADCTEFTKLKHEMDLKILGKNYFLFRDPGNKKRPDLPITAPRIGTFWLKLLEEMERRLNTSDEKLLNGKPIRLIKTRDKNQQPVSGVFDLHSLRVTLITALFEEGMPSELLMKIVGHASIVMLLHYVKLSPEDVSQKLDRALVESQSKTQLKMVEFIKKASRQELEESVAFRHHSSLESIVSGSGAGMLVMDHGICPVAAKRCHEGLAVTDHEINSTKYQPVPGLSSNCVRCRFFITGPSFLVGLVEYVNNLSYSLRKSSYEFEKSQEKFDSLSDSYAADLESGKIFTGQRELENASTVFETNTAKVDLIILSLHAAYILVEQCIQLTNRPKENSTGFDLVAAGGIGEIEAILFEGHEIEQLHRICQAASIFDGLNIDWQRPNLERARLFDRMLRRSGLEPILFSLDDDQSRRVANEMGDFLYARLDRDSVHDLIDGKTSLKALGIDKEFINRLEALEPKKLTIDPLIRLLEVSDE